MMTRGMATNAKLLGYGGIGPTSGQQLCYLELAPGKAVSLTQIVSPGLPDCVTARPVRLSPKLNSQLTHLVEGPAKLVNQLPAILAEG